VNQKSPEFLTKPMQIKRALIIMRSRALNKNLAAWPKVPLAARTDTSAKKEHKSRDMEWSSQSQALSYHGVVVLVPSIHHEQCKVLGQVFFICFSFLLVQYQTTSTTPLLSCLSLSLLFFPHLRRLNKRNCEKQQQQVGIVILLLHGERPQVLHGRRRRPPLPRAQRPLPLLPAAVLQWWRSTSTGRCSSAGSSSPPWLRNLRPRHAGFNPHPVTCILCCSFVSLPLFCVPTPYSLATVCVCVHLFVNVSL
jgi:hypothetical protein